MSQAEELLDSLDETIPTHQHDVIDSDSYFVIDPITRAVENTSKSKNLLMQYDHASERYTFELPRYVEGHDMSLCTAVKVHYNNIESGTLIENSDVNDLDDLHVDPTDANKVICSWLIKRQATQLVGSLNFLVQYLCATSDGTITYEWHSDIYKNIEIREGRNNGPAAVSDYTDILEQWRAKLSGADGTSVFQYAQEGGYTGTEEEFRAKLAKEYYTYDELHDKPFGEEKVYDTIFENVELTSTSQYVTGSNTVYVSLLNSPVKVIYNNVEYIFDEDSNEYGDRDLVNYPFYITCYKDGRWIVENENSGDIISLYASKIIINQLNEKFIPDVIARIPDWNVSATDSTNRIDNKPFGKVLDFVECDKTYAKESDTVYSWWPGVDLKHPFKLIHNGIEYVFDTFPFGDESFIEYPFYIKHSYVTLVGMTDSVYTIQTANAEDVIEFYSTEEVDKQLDEAYIPDTIARTEDIPTIPTQLSAFENDSEFITNTVDNLTNYYLKSETYTQDEVKALVSAIPKFSIQVVDTLPTEDISTTTVYLVKSGEETDNLYTEYIYVNGAWEYLGKQTVDLSGYALATDVPTKLSELTNDSDFQTGEQVRAKIAEMTHFTFSKANSLEEVTSENVIYLVPNTTTDTNNIYDEYLLVDGEPELIGSTAIDLSGYVLKEDLPETLPNPQALTFTGAVEGSYDGNEPIEINIPDNSFQLDVLGWKTFKTITIEEADVYEVVISADEIDVSFEEFGLIFYLPNAPETTNAVNVTINGNYNAVLDNVLSLNSYGYFNMFYMHGVDACYMAYIIQRHTTYTNNGTCTTHLTDYPVATVKSMRIMSRNSVVPFVTGMQVTIIYR